MGIDYTGLEALLHSLKYINKNNNKTAITLGRQHIHIYSNTIDNILDKYLLLNCKNRNYSGSCETLLHDIFGFESIDSIDNSRYEGASIIHNMNDPIPNDFKKYDFVLDLGTIEHIFNVPQVCENIINLLNIGGTFLSVTVNNNFSGHGIYQFSPEFYLSAFSKKYGMEIQELYIAKINSGIESWINVNNYGNTGNSRNESRFGGDDPVYIIAIIKKISNERENLILNSPNQFSYEEMDWKSTL
jgi:SAM-dependent methyltransferase